MGSLCLAVLVFQLRTPAGLDKMAFLKLALFALLAAPALGARRLRGNVEQRNERSLTNTFPFNRKAGAEEHHGEHHEAHHGHHEASELASRGSCWPRFRWKEVYRQGGDGRGDGVRRRGG